MSYHQIKRMLKERATALGYDCDSFLPENRAAVVMFSSQMNGKDYGREQLFSAWTWFYSGWVARQTYVAS
jgi:hypothetical protein